MSLDCYDLRCTFQRFGQVYVVQECQELLEYYVFLNSFYSAYIAMKLMNGFWVRHTLSQLLASWCVSQDYTKISHVFQEYHEKVQWIQSLEKQNNVNVHNKNVKLTCRYDIQIENEKQFQVARRIIGSKGSNMKKIIECALELSTDKNVGNNNELLKLRLRGQGSGYKQGPQQLESQENLHLCISSKDQAIYTYACQSVEKLLQAVYCEYQDFTRKQGRVINLRIKRCDIFQGNQGNQINNESMMLNSQNNNIIRMQGNKIEHLLDMRNKARRELNFVQADKIRNYLRSCGVCLIDEKGRRGRATEVTTWKYLV